METQSGIICFEVAGELLRFKDCIQYNCCYAVHQTAFLNVKQTKMWH